MKKLVFVLLLLVSVGCSNSATPQVSFAYPGPSSAAYPGPSGVNPVTRTALPVLNSTVGNVTGRLVGKGTHAPLQGLFVYLGDLVPLQDSSGNIVTLKQNASPHTSIDSDGYFVLLSVKPDTYALVAWTPIKSMVIVDPQQPNQEYHVVVKAGETADIGEVELDWP